MAPTPQPSRVSPASAETYSYVSGLDPKGDNFLALRSGSEPDAIRIATMGPDTLLKVAESRGVWRRIVLLDGATGWAHSNYIACCRTTAGPSGGGAAAAKAAPPAALAKASGDTCESLWLRRNTIWKRNGYCFTSTKAKQALGNAGCSRDQAAARAAMSPTDLAEVDALSAKEQGMGCQ